MSWKQVLFSEVLTETGRRNFNFVIYEKYAQDQVKNRASYLRLKNCSVKPLQEQINNTLK